MIQLATTVLAAVAGVSPTSTQKLEIRQNFQALHECVQKRVDDRASKFSNSRKASLKDADILARKAISDCRVFRAKLNKLPVVPYAFSSHRKMDRLIFGLAQDSALGALGIFVERYELSDAEN